MEAKFIRSPFKMTSFYENLNVTVSCVLIGYLCNVFSASSLQPVSYTHLDVYKRQHTIRLKF